MPARDESKVTELPVPLRQLNLNIIEVDQRGDRHKRMDVSLRRRGCDGARDVVIEKFVGRSNEFYKFGKMPPCLEALLPNFCRKSRIKHQPSRVKFHTQLCQLHDHDKNKMTSVRPMRLSDLLHFNTCNLDNMTETYYLGFYMEYLSKWPELCRVVVDFPGGHGHSRGGRKRERRERIVGYGMYFFLRE